MASSRTYRCVGCGATACKLWREYGTSCVEPHCLLCAQRRCSKDLIEAMVEGHAWTFDDWVPAVPTDTPPRSNMAVNGWLTVWDGREEVSWWLRQPTLPEKP